MTEPLLGINPQLTDTYTRERWISESFEKNGSESARASRVSILSRLDHYCNKVHNMQAEEVFLWMKKESKKADEPLDILTQYAIDFLSRYVKFCQEDHKDILIRRGSTPTKSKPSKTNYLHKLHNNSISGNISRSRQFMSQVGGIRIHDDDMKRVPIPNTVKRGMYEDEEAEALTAEQSRNVIQVVKQQRSVALYNFMNDTGFRISEAGMVKDSDFDFYAIPPTVKTPNVSVKGVMVRGVRFLRMSTAFQIKTIMKSDKHFVFRFNDSQSLIAFRQAEYKKIKNAYDSLGMTQIYEDTGRRKYNLHSWRKRCSTEYARANNESMADGYLRHSKYLAQYHQKTKEERVEAFRKAEMDLAIDETEKKNAKIKELESDKTQLIEMTKENSTLLQRLDSIEARIKEREEALDKSSKQFNEDIANGKQDEIRKRWAEEESRSVPMDND